MTFRRTVMQDMITSFTTIMTWLVLLLCAAVVVLLGLSAWPPQWRRRRALLGVMAMAMVMEATGMSLMLLSQKAHSWTGLLLPLAALLLMVSLYRLCFPLLAPVPPAHQDQQHQLLLLLLTLGTLVTTAGLVLLDLFFLS
jgi:hypothetical protein